MLSFFIEENPPISSDFNKKNRFASLSKRIFLVGLTRFVTFLDLFLLLLYFPFLINRVHHHLRNMFLLIPNHRTSAKIEQQKMDEDFHTTMINLIPEKFFDEIHFHPGTGNFKGSPGGCFQDHPSYSNQ